MMGTQSCRIAARVAVRPRSARYQIAYPSPDVRPPDTTASNTPRPFAIADDAVARFKAAASGAANRKLRAFAANGCAAFLPASE